MKKIWPWIGLLLLLMILCVTTKVDTIHTTHTTPALSATTAGLHQNSHRSIDFDIVQKGNSYRLSGHFKNTAQQQKFAAAFAQTKHPLQIGNTSTNQTLGAQEVIVLVESIIPYFATHYKNGHIAFHNNKLSINGTVDSYSAKRNMEHLLSSSTILTEDNSMVMLPKEPITFRIEKRNNLMSVQGVLHDPKQSDMLTHTIPQSIHPTVHLSHNATRIDTEGALTMAQHILPLFSKEFTQGYILYENHRFTVNGLAKDQAALEHMKSLLAQSKLSVVDQTKIDPVLAKKAAEEEAARLARQKAEAEARKAAQLKAEAEAKAAAEAEAARKAAQAAKEAEQQRILLAQEEAKREAQAAKENISKLLKIENIAFEVAKDTLTAKGRETVDKLAAILKKYPHIHVEIAGHTDSDGDADFNQKLSQARVERVKKALIEQGIDAARLKAVGYGESKPLVPNTSAENKQKNRRVEINIIGE